MAAPIKVYSIRSFTSKFMPSDQLEALYRGDLNQFMVVKLEDMYVHVNQSVPASRTTGHICIFVTEGEAILKVGSESYTVRQNWMVFVPAGQVFSFEPYEVNRGYLCTFTDSTLIGKFGKSDLLKQFDFLRIWGNPIIRLDTQTAAFVSHIFRRILIDYLQHDLTTLDIIQPYLVALLSEVNRFYEPLSASSLTSAVTLANRFRELVFTDFRTKHRVTDYASALTISPNHLNKTVKAVTGKSPTKWIDEAILLEAKVLLSQTDLPISDVAGELGFDDQAYFARLFKKYEGLTPSAYRKMIETS